MRVRKELNAFLYRQKMDERGLPNRTPDYSIYDSICRGDIEKVKEELAEGFLSPKLDNRKLSKSIFRNSVYHFVLSASALAEASISCGMGTSEAYAIADIYILKADECKQIEKVYELFENMCLDFAERIQEIRKETVISLHIRKCIEYIYENLGVDLSIKALANELKLNSTYLSRLFQKEVGIPLKQFVKEARIDTAQNLLRYSDKTYLVIATSLGFSSQSSFISSFKEIVGMTPKVYREQYYNV